MTARTLVVADDAASRWLDEVEPGVDLVFLAAGEDDYVDRNAARWAALDVRLLPLDGHVAEAERMLQEFYPPFVRDAARAPGADGRSLLDDLARPGQTNLWWFTDACEKGPLRSPLPTQLYRVALLRRVLAERPPGRAVVDLADGDLAATVAAGLREGGYTVAALPVASPRGLRAWLEGRDARAPGLRQRAWRVWVTLRWLANRMALRASGARPRRSATPAVALFTRWPVLWRNPFRADAAERYFENLEPQVRARGEARYLAVVSCGPLQLLRERRGLGRRLGARGIEPLPLHLPAAALLRALREGRPARAWARFARRPARREEFAGFDVAPLWRAEVRRGLTGPEVVENQLLEAAAQAAVRRGGFRVIVNPLEFQPMERALWSGAREAATVAFQHSTFSRNNFIYFFAPGELAPYAQAPGGSSSPLPALALAAGPFGRDVLLADGFPSDRLAEIGALRYNSLRLRPLAASAARAGSIRVLLALPLSPVESRALVILAERAAASTPDVTFLFRCHYHSRIEPWIRERMRDVPAARWAVLDPHAPLESAMADADAVLTSGSAVALEALAEGKVVILHRSPAVLNLTPLLEFPGAAVPVASARDLVDVLGRVATGEIAPDAKAREESLSTLLGPLDGRAPERTLRLLEERGILP